MLQQLKSFKLIHGIALLALASVVTIAIYSALSGAASQQRLKTQTSAVHQVARDMGAALAAIDSSLADTAMRYASGVASPRAEQARFESAAADFFRRSDDADALVIFKTVRSADEAATLSRPIAEAPAHFPSGDFFLAPQWLKTRDDIRAGTFPLSGRGGVLPATLTASEPVLSALRYVVTQGAPTSSGIFLESGGTMQLVQAANRNANGSQSFWRFAPIRITDPNTGGTVHHAVVGALVDVDRLLAQTGQRNAQIRGPLDKAELGRLGVFEGGLPLGEQALAVTLGKPVTENSSWRNSILAGLAGLVTLLGAGYVLTGEAEARTRAERGLSSHKRKFKKRTAELKRSEDRFRRLAESTNVVPWAADVTDKRFTYIGPQIQKMTGYPVSSWCSAGFWFSHVHPDDRRSTFGESFRTLKPGDFTTLEYRIRAADGRILFIRNMMTVVPRKGGGRVAQGYMLDVTEMKTAQDKLKAAHHQAEEANKTKSEFLANMSHELRTPLNAVIGFAEVMKDELFGPIGERYKEYAENVHASGKHLLDLINDVLDLSKIEAGKIELIEEETDLGGLLSECRTVLHERASSTGLHIRLEIPKPLPMVVVDNRRLKQVILNLMSNAIKFTAPGGRLTLRGELHPPRGVRLTVSDTGIGMTQAEQEIAVKQFGQIDSELARQNTGTGLGLPITKSLLELHGGELELESTKGIGTDVHCWLPMNRITTLNTEDNDAA